MSSGADSGNIMRWLNVLVLLSFGWLAILIELAPINEEARALPAPDLLYCVVAFLILRRPSATPAFLIVFLGLARDLISGAPVGLGAITLLGAAEIMRATRDWLGRHAWIYEFGVVVALAFGMTLVQVVLLTVTFAPIPSLEQLGFRLVETGIAYVVIYIIFRWILRMTGENQVKRSLTRRVE